MNKVKFVKIESRQTDKSFEVHSLEEADQKLNDLTYKNSFEDDKFDVLIIWENDKKIKTRIDVNKSNRSNNILTKDLNQMKNYWLENGLAGDEIKSMVLAKDYEGLV